MFAAVDRPADRDPTKDMWPPYLFAATYLAQAAVAIVAGLTLMLLKIPMPPAPPAANAGRPLAEIVRQPKFIVAVVCGIASYAMMNMVMTAAPLAMIECNHTRDRCRARPAMACARHVCAELLYRHIDRAVRRRARDRRRLRHAARERGVSISGITLWHFWVGLGAARGRVGISGFIGATALVTQTHRPQERNRVQSFNDFLIFGSMAIGSFGSGKVLAVFGWAAVNEIVFPVVLTAAAMLLWLALRERRKSV